MQVFETQSVPQGEALQPMEENAIIIIILFQMLLYVAHSCCPAILRCQDCGKSPGFQLCQVCGVEQNTSFLCLTFLIYRSDSWTTKKARPGRIDALELRCWRRLLGIYPEETIIVKDISTPVVIATLFTVARTWKQPRCP